LRIYRGRPVRRVRSTPVCPVRTTESKGPLGAACNPMPNVAEEPFLVGSVGPVEIDVVVGRRRRPSRWAQSCAGSGNGW
jgi:hypothetical protein